MIDVVFFRRSCCLCRFSHFKIRGSYLIFVLNPLFSYFFICGTVFLISMFWAWVC
ncbi:unnamed protein product [Meloidogyne enterolobii]|uniref:Uncharacterized protein n=1 Tax=Meloidogyne enterolobii TaxID=390850 RepID=A0ACB0ZW65_MELEN